MLNLESLLEEAKNNGLPIQKRRAVLREYLQVIILNSIYKHRAGRKMFFMGGTALRYFYNLPRFSEDLDFNASGLKEAEFDDLLAKIKDDLAKEGFIVEAKIKNRDKLFIANLEFKNALKAYNIIDTRGMFLMVKIEINQPDWQMVTEPDVLSMYGYNFSCILMSKGNLLSEKVCALLNRNRGRDIYDTLFMLSKKFPFNESVLKFNKIESSPEQAVLNRLKNIPPEELKTLARQVEPFLFKEDEVEMVLKAPFYGQQFLSKYHE